MTDDRDAPEHSRWTALSAAARRNRGALAGAGALAALAGAALFNRGQARRAEAANPPLGRLIEVGGVRLHYVDRGAGRPVVLLHGNGAMIEDWAASGVLDLAARNHRVIAFDRPGFGHSDRPRSTVWTPGAQAALLMRALREIGIERPIVVGHSWGTLVALAMALDFPGEVAALVLLSGYYFPTARIDVPSFSPPALPLLGDVMRFTVSPIVGRFASPVMTQLVFAPEPVAAGFAGFPVEMALRPGQIRATAADTALMIPAAAALGPRCAALALPVEIVAGEGDMIADFAAHSERLHRAAPASALRGVAGAGHMFHYAAPAEAVAAIDRAAARAAA